MLAVQSMMLSDPLSKQDKQDWFGKTVQHAMQANICGRQDEEEASLLICNHDETPGSKSEPRLDIYCLKARSLACVLLLISRAWRWLNSALVSYRLAPCNNKLQIQCIKDKLIVASREGERDGSRRLKR